MPKLISQNFEKKFSDFIFLFNLYFKMGEKDFIRIYKEFPYMLCLDRGKIQGFLGQFKKYRFTSKQVIKVCTQSGGLLGHKISNLTGLFETCKQYGISAKEVI